MLVLLEEAAEAALSAGVWDMTGVGDDEGTTKVMRRMVDDIKMARAQWHRRLMQWPHGPKRWWAPITIDRRACHPSP